jgi:DNA (cytosine-5)-methyltransferase 1
VISTTGRNITVVKYHKPCPGIQAGGIGGGNTSQYYIDMDNKTEKDMNKPEYKLPTMAEIKAIQPNGYKVVSTFSGCGGSCLGYRMAGFKVIWANEFVPIAQESYKANHESFLDGRDIRVIKPEEILKQIGMSQGELDLFDGSPPCQAFSTAGKREKGWGKDKTYEHGAKQKNEDLFFEYVRILKGLMPKVFVAENVSGLLKGTAKGYFIDIMKQLKACGYNVKCKLLDAQWLGVPQMRQRAIFIGVRNDLKLDPVYPKPLTYRYSVRDAISEIKNTFQSGQYENKGKMIFRDIKNPSQTVTTLGGGAQRIFCTTNDNEKRKFTISEVKRICSFPDDFILKGSYAQQWERMGNSVPPVMMFHIAKTVEKEILCNLTTSP